MRNAIGIWSSTNHLEEEQTGSNTERWYKQIFFDNRIQEIALTNKRFQDLINWVKKYKLPAIETIKFNGHPYNQLDELQQALYQSYNTAQNRLINLQLLNEILLY